MTIVSDAPSCGITYECHFDNSRGVIYAHRENLQYRCHHRHLRKIDLLMTCAACLVCFVSTVSGCSKNALGRGRTSNRHITKLEQSIFSLDIYGYHSCDCQAMILLFLQLWPQGRVFNSGSARQCLMHLLFCVTKLPNLELKTFNR